MIFLSGCQCYGHAEECYHNDTVASLELSQTLEGLYSGGGVCIGCTNLTAGKAPYSTVYTLVGLVVECVE